MGKDRFKEYFTPIWLKRFRILAEEPKIDDTKHPDFKMF